MMVVVFTQNQAIINISHFNAIYASQDEDGKYVITDGQYILGKYDTEADTISVLQWLANSIATADTKQNLVITMPILTSKKDNTNDTTADA